MILWIIIGASAITLSAFKLDYRDTSRYPSVEQERPRLIHPLIRFEEKFIKREPGDDQAANGL